MHTVWKVQPGSGDTDDYLQDIALRGDLLYYRCPSEAGCIQTATGRYLWRHSFSPLPPQGQREPQNYDRWHLVVGGRCVYTVESRYAGNIPPPAFHLYALQRDNGQQAWEYVLKQGPLGPPCAAGEKVLIPLNDGTVLALNSTTGQLLWRKPIAVADSRTGSVLLQVVGDRLIAQIGSGHIAAFRLQDGKQLWSYPGTHDEDGNSEGFAIDHNMVYVLLRANELAALDIADGHRLWSRHTNGMGTPSGAVFVLGDRILSTPLGDTGSVRKRDGKTLARRPDPHRFEYVRKPPFVMPWASEATRGGKPQPQLFETIDGMQLVDGVPRSLRSISVTETLVMLDAATGAERWRWQPEDGVFLAKILSDGHRIYLQTGRSLRAVEDGPIPGLPTAADQRRELARFLVQAVFHGFTMFDKEKGRWVHVARVGQSLRETPDNSEATLNLVRLGADSVPAVMEQVHQDVAERDKRLPDPKELTYTIYSFPDRLSDAMDLLTDIGDRSCVPGLTAELSAAKHPVSRMTIARALIRLGDPRALPALMQYARTAPNDPNTRQDALFAIARSAQQDASMRNELTQYLLTALNDASAPASIRLFARFELLNDHGAEARAAALAAFQGGKPGGVGIGRPNGDPGATVAPGHEDRNASVPGEPETNEAGILRATVEALCQVGRDGDPMTKPVRFGGSTTPLVLPLPPGSHGVAILGHPGPVVFRQFTGQPDFPGSPYSSAGYSFTPPHIDLKGYYHTDAERRLALNAQFQDPYAELSRTTARKTQASFHDIFPYEISADGNRARIGWEQRDEDLLNQTEIGFDIEVRRIGGRWYPVECRRIFASGRHWEEEAVMPETRR